MGHVDLSGISYHLPDGRVLLDDVSFRVGEGAVVALVGANGSGKTTLLKIIAGDLPPDDGHGLPQRRAGRDAPVHRQHPRRPPTVRDLLFSLAPPRLREAVAALDRLELELMERRQRAGPAGVRAGAGRLRRRRRLRRRGDSSTPAAPPRSGSAYDRAKWREVTHAVRREQKRLALEALLRGPDEVLLLDEPDNYLDVPGKRWLEDAAASHPEVGAAGQPRPRAAGPRPRRRSPPSSWAPRATRLDPRRRLRDLRTRRGGSGSSASTSSAAAGTSSTRSCRRWC